MTVTPQQPTLLSLHDAHWRTYPIPGGTPEVEMSYLHVEPDKAFTTVVRFPPGWSRPDTGWYDQIEEVLFLEGSFVMSGITYNAADYGWFPAGYAREGSSSTGALALAWFSGPNRWSTEPSPVAAAAAHGFVRRAWPDLPALPSPLGIGKGRLLMRSSDRTSWMVDEIGDGAADHPLELFSMPSRIWSRVLPGERIPELAGPLFCRLYG